MKRRNYLLGFGLTAFAAMAFGLASCSDPVKPNDENHDKDHDEAYRVEVTLTKGHFHDNHFHAKKSVEGAKYYDANMQKFVFESDPDKGFVPVAGTPKAFVVYGGLAEGKMPSDTEKATYTDNSFIAEKEVKGDETYGITVRFFAKDGDEITGEFGTEEESLIHQLFFIPTDIKATEFNPAPKAYTPDYKYIGYYYMDTTPWNSAEGKFTGISNPIGLNGAIEFYEPNTKFDLRIRLLHAKQSKYVADGKASPFYKPTAEQLSREDWEDLDIRIPVVVFAGKGEYLSSDSYETMTDADKRLVKKLAAALDLTERQAFEDLKAARN